MSIYILGENRIMAKAKKTSGKLDIHVYLNAPLSDKVRADAKTEQRSFAQLVRFIIAKHYEAKDSR